MQRPTRSSHTKTTRPERVDIRVGDLSTHPNRAAIQAVLDEPDPVNLVDPKKRIYWDDELLKRRAALKGDRRPSSHAVPGRARIDSRRSGRA